MKITKKDYLPAPPKKGEDWIPIVKLGRTCPFGYEEDPENEGMLLPVIKELELLEEAKKLLKDYSLRTVAEWLTQNSGRYISHVGLQKRVKQDVHRNRSEARLRTVYKELQKTARAIEAAQKRTGGKGNFG